MFYFFNDSEMQQNFLKPNYNFGLPINQAVYSTTQKPITEGFSLCVRLNAKYQYGVVLYR